MRFAICILGGILLPLSSSQAYPKVSLGVTEIFRHTFENFEKSLEDLRSEIILKDYNAAKGEAYFLVSETLVVNQPCRQLETQWKNSTSHHLNSSVVFFVCNGTTGAQISLESFPDRPQNLTLSDWLSLQLNNWEGSPYLRIRVNWQVFDFVLTRESDHTKILVTSQGPGVVGEDGRPLMFQLAFYETKKGRLYYIKDARGVTELSVFSGQEGWEYSKNGLSLAKQDFTREMQALQTDLGQMLRGLLFYEAGSLGQILELLNSLQEIPGFPGLPGLPGANSILNSGSANSIQQNSEGL